LNIISDLLERHALEIPVWGHLPAAMRLKQAAVERVGAPAAFDLLGAALQVPGLDVLQRRRRAALGSTARAHGVHFSEVWSEGEPFLRESLHVMGGAAPKRMSGRRRSAYLACLENARVRGRSSLVAWNDFALEDAERDEAAAFSDNPEYDPGILAHEVGAFWMMEASEPALRIEEAFWLGGSHTVDFGHWITEYLPKLMIALRGGLPGGVPVLVDLHIPATIRQALPVFLPEGTPVITVPHLSTVQADRLWVAPTPQYAGFYATQWDDDVWDARSAEPASTALLLSDIREMTVAATETSTGLDKLFLARRPGRNKKKLVNHVAIEAMATGHGFHVLYPEDFSFIEQLRLARHARHIIAPDGSNSLLALFSSAGARLCTLSPPYTYPLADIGSIMSALGSEMTVVVGDDMPVEGGFGDFWNDYHIDPALFSEYLNHHR
jgi:capsular polysaccharide biosynthesis protein